MTTPARWLNAEEQRTWRLFIQACEAVFGATESQLIRDSGIPHGYYEVLVHLSEAPGRALRMTQLANASTYSKSRLSHAVARLEQRGWVVRRDCPTDRRGQVAQLTDQGFAALAAAAPGHVEQVRRSLIDVLSPEQVRQLGDISAALVQAGARCLKADARLALGDDAREPADGRADLGPACDDAELTEDAELARDELT